MIFRNHTNLFPDESGAVMMEYVIIGLLIAVAGLLGVIIFSRAVFGGLDTAQLGASGDSKGAKDAQVHYRSENDKEAKNAGEFHDSMHTGNTAQ